MKEKISKLEKAQSKLEQAKFISVSDLLALIGPVVTDRTIQLGIRSRDIPGIQIGKRLMVSSHWVKTLLLESTGPSNTTDTR